MIKKQEIWRYWLVGLFGLVLSACQNGGQIISPIPTLSIAGMSLDTVQAHQDTLTLFLVYEDQDGDLGALTAEERPLWIKDSRLPFADSFYVAPLAPLQATVWIKGTLAVQIPRLFLLSNDQEESLFFSASIQDRSLNWSNVAISEKVVLVK